jgi:hypothetical protein
VEILRALSARDGDTVSLAQTLRVFVSVRVCANMEIPQAMAAISEALDTYTRLAKANPRDFEPELHQAIR